MNPRDDLYATQTGFLLHHSTTCCGHRGNRRKVREHSMPSFFYTDDFQLCRVARRYSDRGQSSTNRSQK